MATVIHGTYGRNVYADVLNKIRIFGQLRPSREGPTLDLGHTTIVLDAPRYALPVGTGRGLNKRIAAAEALQLIGAFCDPERLVDLAPQLKAYAEDDGTFWGAYGVRVKRQVSECVTKLRADPWTRQAVVTLWDRHLDNVAGKRDYPCTVALGFTLQPSFTSNKLDMHVTMRSNDAWLGLPYDMFQFTQLFQTVCRILEYEPGVYRHTAWSLHLYERDVEASNRVTAPTSQTNFFDPTGFGEPGLDYRDVVRRARTILEEREQLSWQPTESEMWYRDVLSS